MKTFRGQKSLSATSKMHGMEIRPYSALNSVIRVYIYGPTYSKAITKTQFETR